MFDSITGFNPYIWIRSIISTFIPYFGIIVFFVLIIALIVSTERLLSSWYLNFVTEFINLWLMLVWAHMLGRFYYKYEEQLYWEA